MTSVVEFPLRPTSHDGSWSKEIHVLPQARMAYTSDSSKVQALQCMVSVGLVTSIGPEERHVLDF